MPKVFGLNLLGLIAGAVFFFILGYLWYAVLFMDEMMQAYGISEATPGNHSQTIAMLMGFINVMIVTLGVGLVLKWLNVSKLATAVKYGLILWLCFALTTSAYMWIYGDVPLNMLLIDGSYNLIGYAGVAAIWSFFD